MIRILRFQTGVWYAGHQDENRINNSMRLSLNKDHLLTFAELEKNWPNLYLALCADNAPKVSVKPASAQNKRNESLHQVETNRRFVRFRSYFASPIALKTAGARLRCNSWESLYCAFFSRRAFVQCFRSFDPPIIICSRYISTVFLNSSIKVHCGRDLRNKILSRLVL
jgi:hypothetical protein